MLIHLAVGNIFSSPLSYGCRDRRKKNCRCNVHLLPWYILVCIASYLGSLLQSFLRHTDPRNLWLLRVFSIRQHAVASVFNATCFIEIIPPREEHWTILSCFIASRLPGDISCISPCSLSPASTPTGIS